MAAIQADLDLNIKVNFQTWKFFESTNRWYFFTLSDMSPMSIELNLKDQVVMVGNRTGCSEDLTEVKTKFHTKFQSWKKKNQETKWIAFVPQTEQNCAIFIRTVFEKVWK